MSNISGKCLCESVTYEISGPLGSVYNCHCSKCRRWHGAAFRSRASVDVTQFKILTGSESLASFKSSDNVTKYFCKVCGSPLHSTYLDNPDVIGIALGALEGVLSKPEANIFTASKASWYEISDGLPQHKFWPTSE
ncbi:MAG: GFA family protein [Saccharospirillaceae bacterium]|nr:GFA family protein [Pseudomonadales bacterium]NRB77430.1 GFA family protein [Saccharospirillaceae bacterium]